VGNASRNETNEILTVYLVKGSALYTGDTDQDDLIVGSRINLREKRMVIDQSIKLAGNDHWE